MWFAIAGVAVNITGSLALFPLLGHVGIAAATSLAGWVTAFLLIITLSKRGGNTSDARLRHRMVATIASSLIMGAALWAGSQSLAIYLASDQEVVVRAAALGALVVAGIGVFAGLAALTGAASPRELAAALRRRPQD